MEGGQKRSFDQMEESSVAVYEFSEAEHDSLKKSSMERPMFYGVHDLDISTKISAIKASAFVVSLVSFSGDRVVTQACGTIIETNFNINTVMTSLNLIRLPTDDDYVKNSLADNLKIVIRSSDNNSYLGEIFCYDYHYNLLIVRFRSKGCLPSAKVMFLENDFVSNRSFQLRSHSTRIIRPGDDAIVVGRYFYEPYEFMASSGLFSMERLDPEKYDCTELLSVGCNTSRCGDGAPVVNISGEVFGISYYDLGAGSPFLPMNVAFKWWNHYKQFKESRCPSYGFEGSDLYLAFLPFIERFFGIFPDFSNGVWVKKVLQGSYAQSAGLLEDDVIVECDAKPVTSYLQLWERMWDKTSEFVELRVARVSVKDTISIRLVVGEVKPGDLNKWPRYDYK